MCEVYDLVAYKMFKLKHLVAKYEWMRVKMKMYKPEWGNHNQKKAHEDYSAKSLALYAIMENASQSVKQLQ